MITSGEVLDERTIDPKEVQHTTIEIARINTINSGVRIWFQIMAVDGTLFQRWSMKMDETDGTLLLSQPGDKLDIAWVENYVTDGDYGRFDPFYRNLILVATFNKG